MNEVREDEALRLHESGTETALLMERYAVSKGAIGRWIRNARKRRNLTGGEKMIATNVGELIEALKNLDPAARIYTIDPPFDGLRLVEQGDGAILFCRPKESEAKAERVRK